MEDPRILDFSSHHVNLPLQLADITARRLIYACGDELGGRDKSNLSITNIEAYSAPIPDMNYNIFACIRKDDRNIAYLTANPQLNIVLCILTGNREIDFPILERLFVNSVDTINTDDTRIYPSAKISFTILKNGGRCENINLFYVVTGGIDINGRVYYADWQWGPPNFIKRQEGDKFIFIKEGEVFDPSATYIDDSPQNTSRNEVKARRLQHIFDYQSSLPGAKQSWVNWHARNPPRTGGKKHAYSRKAKRKCRGKKTRRRGKKTRRRGKKTRRR
jgi:hypothetical protein